MKGQTNTGSRLAVLSASLLSFTLSCTICNVNADAQSFAANQTAKKRPALEPDTLKDKVALKDMPEYTGKQKFFAGRTMKTPIGPQYQQQFIAQEEPAQVIAWYKSALSSYKWDVYATEDNAVSARKPEGARVSVIVNPYHRADGRAMVTVNYADYQIKQQQTEPPEE